MNAPSFLLPESKSVVPARLLEDRPGGQENTTKPVDGCEVSRHAISVARVLGTHVIAYRILCADCDVLLRLV
jgi:hypothetical protein